MHAECNEINKVLLLKLWALGMEMLHLYFQCWAVHFWWQASEPSTEVLIQLCLQTPSNPSS